MFDDMARPRHIDKKRKETGSKLIALRITPTQFEHLKRLAAREGVSVSELVRRKALRAA